MDPRRLIGYLWIAFALIWLLAALTVKRAARRESSETRIFRLILTFGGFVLIFATKWPLGPLDEVLIQHSALTDDVGLALTIAGIAFAILARAYLGRNWSGSVTVKKDHELIRTGPYSIVRHPIYTGLLLAALGGAIALGWLRGFIGVLLLAVALRVKSRLEEQFMQEQFGDQYISYKRDVKALIPFVW